MAPLTVSVPSPTSNNAKVMIKILRALYETPENQLYNIRRKPRTIRKGNQKHVSPRLRTPKGLKFKIVPVCIECLFHVARFLQTDWPLLYTYTLVHTSFFRNTDVIPKLRLCFQIEFEIFFAFTSNGRWF